MENKDAVIGLIGISMIFLIIVLILSISIYNYYIHHSYISGKWINNDGDILLIRNLGKSKQSEICIGTINENGNYDLMTLKTKINTSYFTSPFNIKFKTKNKDMNLKFKVNMVKGLLTLYKDNKKYGQFYKSFL